MDDEPPPLTIVPPGEGRTADLGDGVGVAVKLAGADTGGSVAVVEHPFAVGAYVSAHLHTRGRVLDRRRGGDRLPLGDREAVLGPGSYITRPRGEMHAMWNAGTAPARMIEIISPAGFELFFRDVADLAEARTTDPAPFVALAASYGLEFGEPDWQADLLRRYGLTPPAW
ncbi:hypothetical protein ABC795_16975 [Blastococcus sp. HT6-30]|uniref:hypothetical protein n=1 Tax=Blastococcus sp. HT6-30 TaxID=3144843 RepID=UPI00321A6E75